MSFYTFDILSDNYIENKGAIAAAIVQSWRVFVTHPIQIVQNHRFVLHLTFNLMSF